MSSNNPKPRKPKSPLSHEKYSAELTSGQLVIGTSVLLLALLVAFMFGVLVGRFQPAKRTDTVLAASSSGAENRAAPAEQVAVPGRGPVTIDLPRPHDMQPASTTDSSEGRQTSPRLDVLDGAPDNAPQPAATSGGPPAAATGNLPTVPTDGASSAGSSDAVPGRSAAGASVLSAPTSLEEIEPPAPSESTGPPREIPRPDRETSSADANVPATLPPPPRASEGRYSVRIAAYGQRQNAERARTALERATSGKFPGEIVDSPTGRLVYLFAGRYADRAMADEARKELRDTYKYSDCYVEVRPRI